MPFNGVRACLLFCKFSDSGSSEDARWTHMHVLCQLNNGCIRHVQENNWIVQYQMQINVYKRPCPCQASLPARFRAQFDPLAASTGFEGIRSWPSSGSRHWRSLGRVPKLRQVLERVGRGKTVAEQGHVPPAPKNQVKSAYLLQTLLDLVQQRCIRRRAACSRT